MVKIILIIILLLPTSSIAGTIFTENYDCSSAWNSWNCSQSIPSCSPQPNTKTNCDPPDTYGGVTHYGGEAAAGTSGNALTQWRHNGYSIEYNGYINYFFSPREFNNHHKQVSSRFYIRFDPGFEMSGAGPKLNRYFIDSVPATDMQGHSYAFMVNAGEIGASFSGGRLTFGNAAYGSMYYSRKTISGYGLNDGNWHCFEVLLKMNSATGVADGEFHCWIDGTEIEVAAGGYPPWTLGVTNVDWGYPTNTYITKALDPGIGNTAGTWTFSTNRWYKVQFDDYVVSTTRIGCDTTRMLIDSSAPEPPIGLKVIQ